MRWHQICQIQCGMGPMSWADVGTRKEHASARPSVLAQLKFEKADFYVSNNTAFNSSLNMAQRVALYAFRQQAIVVRRPRSRNLPLTCAR